MLLVISQLVPKQKPINLASLKKNLDFALTAASIAPMFPVNLPVVVFH